MAQPSRSPAPEPRSKRIRGGWALEAAGVFLFFYPLFSRVRDLVGVSRADAFDNAKQVIDWEQDLGIYHERAIQEWFLPYRWFIGFWNLFYGSVHFVAPIVTLVALYRFDPGRYVRWRNTFVLTAVVSLIGFWLYPLMPPRLLPSSFGFVDTRLLYFTIGKPVPHSQETGNLYAAMPSLHIAWATWTVFALWPLVRPVWARVLVASYPALMIFSTVVTGNHWLLDAVGGWGALALGYALARWRDWWPWWPNRRAPVPAEVRSAAGRAPPGRAGS
jgi:membrane-associated phospholipid phosphatase